MQGKQAKIVSPTQERAILGYLVTTRYPTRDRVMFLLSMKAGLRAKEMASLTWAMVTDAAGQVAEVLHVPNRASKGKTGGRTIPLHPDLQAVLVTLQTARGDMASPERSILFSERGGGYRHLPDPPRALRRRVAAVRIGGWVVIEDADFSSLRAVEATHPLAASPDRHLREL